MRSFMLQLTLGLVLVTGPAAAQEQKAPAKAGWPGIVPELTGYARTIKAPRVAKGKDPVSYEQVVSYLWTGGSIRMLNATFARNPAYKKDHAPAALRRAKPAPREIKLGKMTGWLFPEEKSNRKLIVPLGEDTALILQSSGMVNETHLLDVAKKFNLVAIQAALKRPPR
jgi:hypothetical protein